MLKIDMHTHIIPSKLPLWAEKFRYEGFIHLEHHQPGRARMMRGDTLFREVTSNIWDPRERIKEYGEHQTQVQVVSTIPVLFGYWAKPKDTAEIAIFLNDHLAQLVADYPKQYIGLGTLPMQDTDLSIKELERCKNIGLLGVQIGSNVNDQNLNEPQFLPIFEACEALDMAVFVHPWNMLGMHLMEKYWLPWIVGMPAETSRAICCMLFGGVLEKLPYLRVCFAHAGGSFLPTFGRIEHGFQARPDLVAVDNPINPREYLGKFWVDSITHDPALLNLVISLVGEDKVTLGSDYPFPLGDLEIGAYIEEMGLPETTIKKIYADNTLAWLGISEDHFL